MSDDSPAQQDEDRESAFCQVLEKRRVQSLCDHRLLTRREPITFD